MQPNKTKLALVLGALFLGVSGNAIAATGSYKITVKTIPDVELTSLTDLSYGTSVFVTKNQACLMNAATPGDAATDKMQYDGATDAKANYGDLTGAGCVNGLGTGTPGVYKIKGIGGNTVNITISGKTGTSFNFSPNSGCIVTYEAGVVADTCDPFVPGISSAKKLPLGGALEDPVTGSGVGISVPGELIFTVGGTVTVGGTADIDLEAGKAYTETFPVNVVY